VVKQSLLFLCLVLSMATSWAVTFESSVDRSKISEGESLILTVRYNNNIISGSPDFNPLKQQFDVLNQQRKNSFQFVNGQSNSWTVWTVHLMPKRLGNLVIPSLNFKGETSGVIQIQVEKLSKSIKSQQQKEVFFHTEIDVKTAYVQGQILYSEKLYFSVPLDNSQLSDVAVDEAVVQPLGETKNYRTQLNGRAFDVYERNYVIYPQVSGEMVIPGPRYTGQVDNGRWRAGRPVSVSHPPLKVQVLPQPASYPKATWLPAQSISLDYNWQGKTKSLVLGEPLTLQIEFKAQGLSQAQLPDIMLKPTKGFKYYPDQAKTQDLTTDKGIMGVRSQSIAIVPTEIGSHTLPEVRIPWWNTQHGRIEYAVIPAQRLTTFDNGQNKVNQPSAPLPSNIPTTLVSDSDEQPVKSASLLWPVISLILLILWLATLGLWWSAQRKKQVSKSASSSTSAKHPRFKDIRQACRNNDAHLARSHILNWAREQWLLESNSLNALANKINDPALSMALQELDNSLFSPHANDTWQGEYLWQLISAHKPRNKSAAQALTPLYPTETLRSQHG
jgi:hypothetical protein